MKKKSSIIKLSVTGVLIVLGFILSFATIPFPFGWNPNIGGPQGINRYNSFMSQISLGIDLVGGIYAVYEAEEDVTSDQMNNTRTALESLLTTRGYTEATVVREGARRLRVEVPDVDNPQEIFNIIGRPARLEFRINDSPVMGGEHIRSARPIDNHQDGTGAGGPAVELVMTSEGASEFHRITGENVGQAMAIVVIVGDEERVVSSPMINTAIAGGRAVITGMGSFAAARELSDQIMSGTFDVQLTLLESSTVSATLGAGALRRSLITGIIGVLLIMLFMAFFYRMLGGAAIISIIIYTILMLFLMAVMPWVQLTLPGIAGIILSIGMSIDANIIIYERIKDEYRKGKSMKASYHAGFKRAMRAIIDSNVTGIGAGVVLFILGTGPVMSFAVIFMMGIAVSMLTNILITRMLIKNFLNLAGDRPKLFGLKRAADVAELPDDFDKGSKKGRDKESVPFAPEPVPVV
ncbi:MAG: protein translocase subunit SecD [Firmicutes bacterium]|nr:protein translocase subunit SecD [Bacillota bacterium]